MKQKFTSQSARALVALLACAAACSIVTGTLLAFFRTETPARVSHPAAAGLTFAERVSYQRAIEDVYWRHRIWPKENPYPKPSLDAVMTQAQIEKKVEDYLRNSQALEDYSHRPITADQLQAEMERMAQHTKQPEILRELFDVLENDPFIIAECLARPILAERLLPELSADDQRFAGELEQSSVATAETQISVAMPAVSTNYVLPVIPNDSPDTCTVPWTPTTLTGAPAGRYYHTAVWTGSEMVVWGGYAGFGFSYFNTGGRYNPSTDSWTPTSTTNAPTRPSAEPFTRQCGPAAK